MNFKEKIKHWYWKKTDVLYDIATRYVWIENHDEFICDYYKSEIHGFKARVYTYSEYFDSDLNLRNSSDKRFFVRDAMCTYSRFDKKKSAFIFKHFGHNIKSKIDYDIIKRNRKLNKI